MNKSLIDTDIISEIGRGFNATILGHAIAYRAAFGRLTTSAVTVMEIVKGFQKSSSPAQLQVFLSNIANEKRSSLFDQPAAELAGWIADDLERIGQPIGVAASMIAAIALVHNLDLVTSNTSHFQRIQQLGYPLTLADWRL